MRGQTLGVRNGGNPEPSSALGWLSSTTLVAHLPTSGCGSAPVAGVFAVPLEGKRKLLIRTPKFEYYWMWGG